MPIFRLIILLATALLAPTSLHAVEVVSRAIKNAALFGIEFPGDARSFYAREASVLSISKQEYVTAAFRVVEVNVVTNGPALLRIYHSRPLKPGELSSALTDAVEAAGVPGSSLIPQSLPPQVAAISQRAGQVADSITSQTVVKEYPHATHAHTIEFRVASRNELLALHDELKKHWLKEPAFYEAGQIVESSGGTQREMRPRNLGGTLFRVEDA